MGGGNPGGGGGGGGGCGLSINGKQTIYIKGVLKYKKN